MTLTYLKGVRTRYTNLIAKELEKAKLLFKQGSTGSDEELKTTKRKVTGTLLKLTDYLTKLEDACEKLATAIEGADLEKEEENILLEQEETTLKFTEVTTETIGELKDLELELTAVLADHRKESTTNLEKILEVQSQLLRELTTKPEPGPDKVKLPKLEIPLFNGDIDQYQTFWDTFEACIHNSDLTNIEKFSYLRSKLTGKASEAISGLNLTNGNYDEAVTILKKRFGDDQAIINTHYIQLMDLPVVKNSVRNLRTFTDAIQTHLRSLKVLKQDTSQDIFIPMITSKLPKEVLLQIEIKKEQSTKWTVDLLMERLDDYVSARESAERTLNSSSSVIKESNASRFTSSEIPNKSVPFKSHDFYQSQRSTNVATAEALLSKEIPPKKTCVYCSMDHWSDECTK